jgi:hypothetical protein
MTIALYVLLGLSVLIDLALGAWASVAWGSFAQTWRLAAGNTQAVQSLHLTGLVLGLVLFFFAALQILAWRWIRAEKEEGFTVLIWFGCYLIGSSLITFLVFRSRPEFLVIDGLRGALLAVFSVAALRSPATVRELRLPEGGARVRREREHQARPYRGGRPERRESSRGAAAGGRRSREDRASARRPSREARLREGRVRQEQRPPAEQSREARERLRPLVTSMSEREVPRTRAREESTGQDATARRSRAPEPQERPLTVVVKGGPDSLRSRPLEESAGPSSPAAPPGARVLAASGTEDHRHRRKRRPRGHRRTGSEGESSVASAEPDAEETSIVTMPMSQETDQPDVEVEIPPEPAAAESWEHGRERGRRRPRGGRRSHGRGDRRSREETSPSGEHRTAEGSGPESSYEAESSPRSEVVEALDMLSLLEPTKRQAGHEPEPEPFGRSRRPTAHHKNLPTRHSETLENRGSEGAANTGGPGAASGFWTTQGASPSEPSGGGGEHPASAAEPRRDNESDPRRDEHPRGSEEDMA